VLERAGELGARSNPGKGENHVNKGEGPTTEVGVRGREHRRGIHLQPAQQDQRVREQHGRERQKRKIRVGTFEELHGAETVTSMNRRIKGSSTPEKWGNSFQKTVSYIQKK